MESGISLVNSNDIHNVCSVF